MHLRPWLLDAACLRPSVRHGTWLASNDSALCAWFLAPKRNPTQKHTEPVYRIIEKEQITKFPYFSSSSTFRTRGVAMVLKPHARAALPLAGHMSSRRHRPSPSISVPLIGCMSSHRRHHFLVHAERAASWVHISSPWRKLIYYLELSYDFLVCTSCLLPFSLQQGRSSWGREDRWS